MVVGDDYIFVHVAKTGGTSVEHILHNNNVFGDIHNIIFMAYKLMPDEEFHSKFKFGFVRNPFDREVSNYFWHAKTNTNKIKDVSFDDWVKWRYNIEPDCVGIEWFNDKDEFFYNKGFARNNQLGHFVDTRGVIITDFIGRYETLNEDWEYIANKINVNPKLPHEYPTERDRDYRKYYSSESVDIIAKAHEIDLKTFNYDFEQGMVSKDINNNQYFNYRLDALYNYYYG